MSNVCVTCWIQTKRTHPEGYLIENFVICLRPNRLEDGFEFNCRPFAWPWQHPTTRREMRLNNQDHNGSVSLLGLLAKIKV